VQPNAGARCNLTPGQPPFLRHGAIYIMYGLCSDNENVAGQQRECAALATFCHRGKHLYSNCDIRIGKGKEMVWKRAFSLCQTCPVVYSHPKPLLFPAPNRGAFDSITEGLQMPIYGCSFCND